MRRFLSSAPVLGMVWITITSVMILEGLRAFPVYNELANVYKPDLILFRMRHQEYGVLPKTNSVNIIQYESGISFALKRKIFNDGLWFNSSYAEDFDLLDRIKNAGYKIVMSPYVKYFVGNYNHTDFDPEKGRRILINHHKII